MSRRLTYVTWYDEIYTSLMQEQILLEYRVL